MSHWTIGRKVFAGVGALTLMIAGAVSLAIRNTADLDSRIDEVTGPVAGLPANSVEAGMFALIGAPTSILLR